MRRYQNPRKTLAFVFIAGLLMVFTDFYFFPMRIKDAPRDPDSREGIYERSEIEDYEAGLAADGEIAPGFVGESIGLPQPDSIKNDGAGVVSPPENKIPRIVIIIDDLGMDRKRSGEVIDLPAPVTLAFLPYAPKLEEITGEARAKGHELLIHAPMQAVDNRLQEGPMALMDHMSADDFEVVLGRMFDSFEGYVGINNHMGSRLTQDEGAMKKVMAALKKRNLIFVDSKTISSSVAEKVAAEYGLAHAGRDVFLDNEDTPEFVEDSLRHLETIARQRGYAVGIGHPRDSTIAALKAWIPGLKEKNIELVPVSDVARKVSSAPSAEPLPPHE